MKVLVTGFNGQLGFDIVNQLKKINIDCVGIDKSELDITDENAVNVFFDSCKYTHIIHCAAWTAVDDAETNEDLCKKVNVDGTRYLVNICKKYNLTMMYFSTDYVYGGIGDEPYKIGDPINPLGVYAKTKYQGELEVQTLDKYFIIRTSWVFGNNGKNFINTMIDLSKKYNEIKVVCDQIGSPTYTIDLSKLACDMIQTDKYGIYHASNEGFVSWSNFAREIFKLADINVSVIDVSTEEYNSKAKRPKNSRLDKSKLVDNGFDRLPEWQDALKRYLDVKGWLKNG